MAIDIGDPAPVFSGVDIRTDKPFNLSDYQDQAVLIAFNGLTWCPPCQFEAPILQQLWQYFNTHICNVGIQFVMVSYLDSSVEQLKAAVDNFGITMPVLVDPTIPQQYEIDAVPMLYFLGKGLKVCATKLGAGGSPSVLYNEIFQQLSLCAGGLQCHELAIVKDLYWEEISHIPWPLPYRLEMNDAIRNIVISQMAEQLDDPVTSQRLQVIALEAASASLRQAAARIKRIPAKLETEWMSGSRRSEDKEAKS